MAIQAQPTKFNIVAGAMVPGQAEALEHAGHTSGNLALAGIGRGMRLSRNTIFSGAILALAGLAGAVLADNATQVGADLLSKAAVVVGTALIAQGASTMNQMASMFQAAYKHNVSEY